MRLRFGPQGWGHHLATRSWADRKTPSQMSNQQRPKAPPRRSDVPARASNQRRSNQRRRPNRRGRRSHKAFIQVGIAVVVVAVAVIVIVVTGRSSGQGGGPAGPEGVKLETGPVLAPAAAVPVAQGSKAIVGCGATEQLATHVHAHLAVFVDGKLRPIPPGVGMLGKVQLQSTPHGSFATGSSTCLYWLHTHAQDGIIHIEAPAGRTFVLGQFFAVWGQPLGSDQVGPATGPVTAYVNGQRWTQNLTDIPLSGHEAIQLDVGTPVVGPKSVAFPSTL